MKSVSAMQHRVSRVEAADASLFFRGLVVAVAGSLLPWAGLAWYIHHGMV